MGVFVGVFTCNGYQRKLFVFLSPHSRQLFYFHILLIQLPFELFLDCIKTHNYMHISAYVADEIFE